VLSKRSKYMFILFLLEEQEEQKMIQIG